MSRQIVQVTEAPPLTEADPQLSLVHGVQSANFLGEVVLTVNEAADAARFRDKGASVVLTPYVDAANHAIERLIGNHAGTRTA